MIAVSPDETTPRRRARGAARSAPFWLFLAVVALASSGPPTEAATFVVDSTGDQGAVVPTNDGICDSAPGLSVVCTLRAAIEEANGSAGTDIINFNILPAGAKTIVLGSFLPSITSVVTIDGTTQPGFVAAPPFAPVIELNAATASSPLSLRSGSSGSTIRGLCINRAPGTAIRILESSNNVIAGNFLGTNLAGTAALGNRVGVYIGGTSTAANNNRIGGVAPADRNVISGNSPDDGIQINAGTGGAADNRVEGNYIGVDVTGALPLGNATQGVALFTGNSNANNVIGGIALNAGNVISGNGNDGVLIAEAGTTGTLVQGNRIGTNAAGTAPIPNLRGIEITNGTSGNTVGGPLGSQNVISGNTVQGIFITLGATNNTVSRALIGTNAAGNAKIPNGPHGVELTNAASNNTIGGVSGTGNVISGNTGSGVNVLGAGTSGNSILGNFIGLDLTGAAILSNTQFGVAIAQGAAGNIVGNATGGNVISGNDMGGVRIVDNATNNNLVQSNLIGLDATGTLPKPNVFDGVILDTVGVATGNRIGGVGFTNVISGNGSAGIRILNGMTGTLVVANIIGRNAANTAAVPNGAGGVRIQAASGNTVGGTVPGEGNVIAGNTGDGVAVVGVGTGNAILGNSSFSNTGLGIDLIDNGVTANDGVKTAGQPNLLMDFPVFTSAMQAGTSLTVAGYVGSAPSQATFADARVEVYNSDNDVSGFGEGRTYLGFLTSDASGNFSGTLDITGKGLTPGDRLSGTATDTGNNTSELAANFGADTALYYSVGTDNTALYSDTASASAGTLTLNSPAVDKIGVGDQIRRGANRYYITGRSSATVFTIQNSAANGGTPGDPNLTFASTAITIFRAFNSLLAAEAGSSDANHLGTSNLVTGNYQLNWPCYGDGEDTASFEIETWTTGPDNYIRIYTPTSAGEVGVSQRHDGKWNATSAYRISSPPGDDYVIHILEDYVRIDGIQVDVKNNPGPKMNAFDNDNGVLAREVHISNNIVRMSYGTPLTADAVGIRALNANATADPNLYIVKVWNNIIYGFRSTTFASGVHADDFGTVYAYNNTVIGDSGVATESYAFDDTSGDAIFYAKNNIGIDAGDPYFGVVTGAGSNNNLSDTGDAPGANPVNCPADPTFVNAGADDYHLADSDTCAKNFGADLSNEPNLAFTTDIDAEARITPWDIGADEAVATRLYRSVGITATTLASGAANALTISGSTATFGSGLPDTIGVGDAIEYDSDGNSSIDALAFIYGRSNSQTYTVKDKDGAVPTAVAGDNDWDIFRAYTRLADWESQTENTNINGAIRNFDTSTDLVTANTIMIAAAYADGADTTAVLINGWTTGPKNYIRIYTPRNPNEVGASQRHNGTWDTTAYRLEVGGATVLEVGEEFVRIDGLQVRLTTDSLNVEGIGITGATGVSRYDISNNIIRGNGAGAQNVRLGLNLFLAGSGVMNAWNNVIYDFAGGSSLVICLAPDDADFTYYLYNNTVVDCADGIRGLAGTIIAKNNIAYNNADNWRGTFDAASTNNLSGPAADPQIPATNARDGFTVTFVNYAGDDFHLAPGDIGAQDFGADLSSDSNLAFAMDIDFGGRRAPWDIGADDVLATTAVGLVSFAARSGNGAVQLLWNTGSELDNLGFHLYRSLGAQGPYERVTETMIPGLGSSPEGASYTYRDSGLTNGVTYYYELEDIETTGATKLHGPVSATPEEGASTAEPEEGDGDQSGSSRITYGKPWENEVRLQRSGRSGLVLELITEGFYAYPEEDGSVRLEVPGLELVAEPGEPAVPVYRGWVEALVGRKVTLGQARVENVDVFTSLRPGFTEAPDVIASSDGTVRAGARKVRRAFLRDSELYPENPAQVVNVAFQGGDKKALVELAPLRWDDNGGRLLLAKRLQVRVSFAGREPSERLLANGKGRRHVENHEGRQVLAQFATHEAGLYAVRFEDVFGKRARKTQTNGLRLSRQGEAVAFIVRPNAKTFKKGSVLYFLSEGAAANPYGHEAAYELEASRSGVTMEKLRSDPVGSPVSEYWKTERREENRLYQAAYIEAEDVWQWDWIFGPMTKSFPFQITELAASPISSKLEVWLQGATDFPESPDHHVRVYVNATLVAEEWWDGETAFHLSAEVGAGVLHEGENVLEVEEVGDTDALYSMVLLDRFEVSYPARLVTSAGRLEGSFDQSGAAWVSGQKKAYVLDVTGEQPQWLTRVNHAQGVGFGAVEGHRYLVVSPDGLLSPEIRQPLQNSLRSEANAAEYVVIGPREFLQTAEPLLLHRLGEGLQTKAVAIEDIYSEFGHGEKTPESVREFLSYAYHHWSEPSVRYVLLLGDATYDPKDFLGTGVENRVPVKLVKTRYLWTASDPWFGAVNGEDLLPDVAVGRLPAASVEELEILVNKILAYESGIADPEAPIVLIADNADAAGDFDGNADVLAASVLSAQQVDKIYLSELGTSATRSAIVNAFDDGASLMSYIGHGAIRLWANENLFNVGDVESLSPQSQQPILFTMNCLNGYFHFPYYNSLSEELLKAESKGIIAAFSPTGLSLDTPAHRFHELLLEQVVNQHHERLGDAILAGQAAYADTGAFPELLSIYHLLGDPALRLR